MATIFFTSGTGGEKKPVIYSTEDIFMMDKAMSHFWELCPTDGITLNTLPAFPHLGYHFAKLYERFSPYPVIHTGGYPVMGFDKHLDFIEIFKPSLLIGTEDSVKELISMSTPEGLSNLKIVVVANGLSREGIDFLLEKGIEPRATYGFDEAKMAWLTGKDWREGYFVFKDCGIHFEEKDGELVFFSKDYPQGHLTGDLGLVKDFENHQLIDFFIRRKDGRSKKIIGCTR